MSFSQLRAASSSFHPATKSAKNRSLLISFSKRLIRSEKTDHCRRSSKGALTHVGFLQRKKMLNAPKHKRYNLLSLKERKKNRSQTKIKARIIWNQICKKEDANWIQNLIYVGFFIRKLSSDVGLCLPLRIIQCHNILKNN